MHDFASTEMATSKQRRSVLILEKKVEIIREIEKGKSQPCVAELFELPKSSVGDIWKDREMISYHVFGAEDADCRQAAVYCTRITVFSLG